MNLTKASAKQYIYKNSQKISSRFRPLFHPVAPIGWMSDICSLVFYHNSYHIFYQYNPYGTSYGPVHAGHIVSYNLTHFYNLPVALAPDRENIGDCYAGGALVNPVRPANMLLAYTQRFDTGDIVERQNIARTKDGVTFIKNPGSLLSEEALPPNAALTDFRDPHPILLPDYNYVFLGSKTLDNVGQILVYRIHELLHAKYHFTIGPNPRFGKMAEHPDFFTLNGKDVLLVSALDVPLSNGNVNSRQSLAVIGKMDFANRDFKIESITELETNTDFFSAQTLLDDKGRRIMIGSMVKEGTPFYPAEIGLGWSGLMTYPRELTIKKGKIFQYPVSELSKNHAKVVRFMQNAIIDKRADLFADIDTTSSNAMEFVNPKDPTDYIATGIENGHVYFDSTHTKNGPKRKWLSQRAYEGHVNVRILLDSCSVEIFLNLGEEAMTSLVFIDSETYQMRLRGSPSAILHSSGFFRGKNFDTEL